MPTTLKDIAKTAGVSAAAVSMALKGHPRIGLARRREIQDLARRMGYKPNMLARSMRTQQTMTIGVLVANLRTTASNMRVEVLEQALASKGYRIQIGFTQSEVQRTVELAHSMHAYRVDGLIVTDSMNADQVELLTQELEGLKTPVVMAGCSDPAFASGLPHVAIDRTEIMDEVVDHLAQSGCEDITFVGGNLRSVNGAKWLGTVAACRRRGLRLRFANMGRSGWVSPEDAKALDASLSLTHNHQSYSTLSAIERMAIRVGRDIATWSERPDAIVTTNDYLALAVIQGLHSRGVDVPEDIAVTGFDNVRSARLAVPTLTTVHEPRRTFARHVVEMLLAQINDEPLHQRLVVLRPRLAIRESAP